MEPANLGDVYPLADSAETPSSKRKREDAALDAPNDVTPPDAANKSSEPDVETRDKKNARTSEGAGDDQPKSDDALAEAEEKAAHWAAQAEAFQNMFDTRVATTIPFTLQCEHGAVVTSDAPSAIARFADNGEKCQMCMRNLRQSLRYGFCRLA